MKKIIMVLGLAVVLLTGCKEAEKNTQRPSNVELPSKENDVTNESGESGGNESETKDLAEEETKNEPVKQTGVSIIGIYCNTVEGDRPLVTTWDEPWVTKKDIAEFGIFPTNEPTLPNTTLRNIWTPMWNEFPDHEKCKIGYKLEINLKTGWKYSKVIKNPDDVNRFMEYIEVYMYDDIRQIPGNWYSHLLMEEINEETIVTSFKLTAGSNVEAVSRIRLTAFVYQSEKDFDENGEYIGNVSYSIDVINGKQ